MATIEQYRISFNRKTMVVNDHFITHIAPNIAETCQKYFQSFIPNKIFSQRFCQILQNISLQHYNFNVSQIFNSFRNIVENIER